jgi:hypothetical protein
MCISPKGTDCIMSNRIKGHIAVQHSGQFIAEG